MYQTYLLVLLYFFHGSLGDDWNIFFNVERNQNKTLYKTDSVLYFNTGDSFIVTCSVSNKVYNGGNGCHLSLSKGGTVIERTDGYIIHMSESLFLAKTDDEVELECKAVSDSLNNEWSISLNFRRNKTDETRMARPNAFKIILFSLGGFIAASIVLLLCYSAIRCLRKKKSSKENRCDANALETNGVTYAQIDLSKKINKQQAKLEDPLYAEVGFVNQSCDIQENDNPTLSKNDFENCQMEERHSYINLQRNDREDKEYDQIKVYANVRHGSSTDC